MVNPCPTTTRAAEMTWTTSRSWWKKPRRRNRWKSLTSWKTSTQLRRSLRMNIKMWEFNLCFCFCCCCWLKPHANLCILSSTWQEDLYFSKVSTCIENEGIAGVLLNKIHVCDDFGTLLIDKDEHQDPEHQKNRHEAEPSTGVFRSVVEFYRSKGIQLTGARLCPDFDFKFTNWDANPNVCETFCLLSVL